MRNVLIILAFLLIPLSAAAQSVEDQVATQLRTQGYDVITMSRTLLGRLRVLAQSEEFERELVINPTTGEILRDITRLRADDAASPRVVVPESSASPTLREQIQDRAEERQEAREDRSEEREERREDRRERFEDDDDDDDEDEADDDDDDGNDDD
ncbi:MAG: hypothetical protein AAFQ64_17275 [Pseudomonadota bacterium]